MKKRLFFALNATDPLQTSFQPTYKKLRINADHKEMIMKWVPLDNFHVTVSFLGELSEDYVPELGQILESVCSEFAPFDLKIEDVGAFSSDQEARVLWLGVQNKKYLNKFKDRLDEVLTEKNLAPAPQAREFTPHLTFARLKNPKSVKDMISPFKRKSFGKIHVAEIILYESKMQGQYAAYKPLVRCKLTGAVEEIVDEVF